MSSSGEFSRTPSQSRGETPELIKPESSSSAGSTSPPQLRRVQPTRLVSRKECVVEDEEQPYDLIAGNDICRWEEDDMCKLTMKTIVESY